jgi:hypothetical protein
MLLLAEAFFLQLIVFQTILITKKLQRKPNSTFIICIYITIFCSNLYMHVQDMHKTINWKELGFVQESA